MAKKVKAEDWLQGEVPQILFKKKPTGQAGQVLVELQKSYKGDGRFELDDRFHDVDTAKLPKGFKDLQADLLKPEEQTIDEEKPLADEINNQLNILSELMPEHKVFIQHKKKPDKRKYDLIIPRFDPMNINKRTIVKKEPVVKQQKVKRELKIVSGVDTQTINIDKANSKLQQMVKNKTEPAQIKTPKMIKAVIDSSAWKQILTEGGQGGKLFS